MTFTNAADSQYRLMHNDHDALVIGEISEINAGSTKIEVTKRIIGAKDLNSKDTKEQLNLNTVSVKGLEQYMYFSISATQNTLKPKVGDYVLVSLVRDSFSFKVTWGAYLVSNLEFKTLSVICPSDSSDGIKMDASAINVFVNSDGRLTEFAFDYSTGIVTVKENIGNSTNESKQSQKVIFDARNDNYVKGSIPRTTSVTYQIVENSSDYETTTVELKKNPVEEAIFYVVILGCIVFAVISFRRRFLNK